MTTHHIRPRGHRNAVDLWASVSWSHGGSQQVGVENLSLEGCCVRGWLLVGDAVRLTIPHVGSYPAEVRWAARGRAGLQFASGAKQ